MQGAGREVQREPGEGGSTGSLGLVSCDQEFGLCPVCRGKSLEGTGLNRQEKEHRARRQQSWGGWLASLRTQVKPWEVMFPFSTLDSVQVK